MGVKKIYMVVGCPGSGKSWVCEQLRDRFAYVRHDDFIKKDDGAYLRAILDAAAVAKIPLLIEAPFSMSAIEGPLQEAGFHVEAVFIQEPPGVIEQRYFEREKTAIPTSHLTRQRTYAKRAQERQAFAGTSVAVHAYLLNAAPRKAWPWET